MLKGFIINVYKMLLISEISTTVNIYLQLYLVCAFRVLIDNPKFKYIYFQKY